MINTKRKTVLTALVLAGTAIIILSIAQSFKGFDNTAATMNRQSDTVYNIKSFKLPDEVTLQARECLSITSTPGRVLEREILTSAYRHSSTILIIKGQTGTFP